MELLGSCDLDRVDRLGDQCVPWKSISLTLVGREKCNGFWIGLSNSKIASVSASSETKLGNSGGF